MTYIKIIFLLILAMLERCHVVKKEVVPLENAPIAKEIRSSANLTGSWRIAAVSQPSKQKSGQPDPLRQDATGNEIPHKAIILSLFPDSTFTEISGDGDYIQGRFLVSNDSTISFVSNNRLEKMHMSFGAVTNQRIILKLKNAETKEERSFAEYAYQLKSYTEDPFYPKNNAWRLKPPTEQSDAEIKIKLSNYILHNCFILKAATERDQAVVSWEFSKGIIKIYNGGIGAVPKGDIPRAWANTFHSPTDALKAHKLFEQYLTSSMYKGASTGNWVKDDYHILVAVYATSQAYEVKAVKRK